MQARDLDFTWQAFDEAAVDERVAHARVVKEVADLLGHMPVGAVVSGIQERCQVTNATARALVAEADELRTLPAVAQAQAEGRLSTDQVSALRVLATPETDHDWVQALHTDFKSELTIGPLMREARRHTARELTERDGGRFLRARPTPDEQFVDVLARMYPEECAALLRKLDSLVPKGTHPDRYATAHVDALMQLVTGEGRGVKATVLVAASKETLNGTSDEPGLLRTGDFVPAPVVRELAGRGKVVMVGAPLRTDGKDIPEENRRYVWLRDSFACRRPGGCTAPARLLDIHHIRGRNVPNPHHPSNMLLLCKTHHRDTQRGWRIVGDAEDQPKWIRPDGKIHSSPPVMRPRPPNVN